jgi:hypothetical protein
MEAQKIDLVVVFLASQKLVLGKYLAFRTVVTRGSFAAAMFHAT